MASETENIRARYDRRKERDDALLYEPLAPYNFMLERERRQVLIQLIKSVDLAPVGDKTVLEVGCGSGTNLLQLMLLGFRPENLVANELLEERAREARHLLPEATTVVKGDATELGYPPETFDVVLVSTVFTSILDDAFQEKLARVIWSLVKPRGGVIWYDFVYNNPRNPDVRGVPVRRIRELFPEGHVKVRRLTLAPPLGRLVTRISPRAYTFLNAFSFLRTHVMCWIGKARS